MEKSFEPDFQIRTCPDLLLRFVQKLQLGRSRLQESKGGWISKVIFKFVLEKMQSYVIKSAPWTILWFRILEIFSAEYIKRLCVFMFQTCSNSQLLRRVLWISAEETIGASLKHKNTQPLYIFNRENPQNSEPQNGPRSGLD